MSKSIKQLAEELNVSKTAVRKKIENLGLRERLQINGNQFLIDEDVENIIKQAFSVKADEESETKKETKSKTESETENLKVSEVFSLLKAELEEKNKQITELQRQLAESQKLIDQAQQLHAADVKRILELEQKQEEREKESPDKEDSIEETTSFDSRVPETETKGSIIKKIISLFK